jgi:hypothetical protein
MFNWETGRQNTGYDKLRLLPEQFFLPIDCYLLRFPEGCNVPPHTDPVKEGYNHFRVNLILKKADNGGEFVTTDAILDWPRLKFFRPDICEHSVTEVKSGVRYLLSIGWLKRSTHGH